MFVENINIVETTTCIYYKENVTVISEASAPLTDMLPYLNRVMPEARYRPEAGVLRFRKGKKLFTLDGKSVTVTRLKNTTEAFEEIDWLKDLINDTHGHKADIAPSYKAAKPATVLDVFRALPRTNCKDCGVSGCMAFAVQLQRGERDAEDCPVLLEEGNKAALAKLMRIL